MTSARVRRRLLASSLFLLTACSESGLQNPAQPQIPPVPGKDAGKGKPGKHPPGTVTIGVYRPSDHTFLLRNTNEAGEPDLKVALGQKGDLPVAGDWDGDGLATVGVYRPSEGKFYLRNAHTPGEPELTITSPVHVKPAPAPRAQISAAGSSRKKRGCRSRWGSSKATRSDAPAASGCV